MRGIVAFTIVALVVALGLVGYASAWKWWDPYDVIPWTMDADCAMPCEGIDGSRCVRLWNKLRLDVRLTVPAHGIVPEEQIWYKFCISVDEFAELVLNQSFPFMTTNESYVDIIVGNNTSVTENIETGNYFSARRYFWNADKTAFSGFYILLINLENGLVTNTSLRFMDTCSDNYCSLPGGTLCIRKRDCGHNITTIKTAESNLDLKIYVAFTGRDAWFVSTQSSGMLPTRFSSYIYAWENYYSTMSEVHEK